MELRGQGSSQSESGSQPMDTEEETEEERYEKIDLSSLPGTFEKYTS